MNVKSNYYKLDSLPPMLAIRLLIEVTTLDWRRSGPSTA